MTTDALAGGRRAEELLAALAEPAGRADPYPLYDRLRALGPAVTAPDGALVITGYQDCSALLRDHRLRKEPERALAAFCVLVGDHCDLRSLGITDCPVRP